MKTSLPLINFLRIVMHSFNVRKLGHNDFRQVTIKLIIVIFLMTTLFGISYGQIPTSGLNALYNFTSGSLEDGTTNDNDFTQTGTSLLTANDRFGAAATAIGLNGDYLTRSDINFPNSGQDLNLGTISFWIKTATNDNNIRTILDDTNGRSDATSDNTWAGYYFYLLDGKVGVSGRVQWSVASFGYQGVGVLSDDIVSNGDWHHVVATVRSNQRFTGASDISSAYVTLYVDGVLQGTSAATRVRNFNAGGVSQSQTLDQTGNITVGNNRDNNFPDANRYQDEIDEIVFHTRHLTAMEITQMATADGFCFPDKTDITISGLGESSIDITLPSDAAYDIAFHKESEPFSSATIITDISDGAESLTNLTSSTPYLIYIRENCSMTLKSGWSIPVRERTQGPLFVDKDAMGAENGTSWSNAYTDLQSALAEVKADGEIWIAEGTYSPGAALSDYFDFDKNNLSIYGGFAGTETSTSERDISNAITILSGDVNGDDTGVDFTGNNRTDNNYHVAKITANSVTLDGLQFNDGHAVGTNDDAIGGGIFIRDQVSGAQALSPTIRNCEFNNNVSNSGGAGIIIRVETGNSNIKIQSCVFDNNVSLYGSGIYFLVDRARTVNFDINNTLFSNNTSKDRGSAQGFTGSSMWLRTNSNQSILNTTITNCTFSGNIDIGNRADSEKGTLALSKVSTSSASAVLNANIYNSIVYGNEDVIANATPSVNKGHEVAANVVNVSHSTSEDSFANATSVSNVGNSDPLFVDASNNDFTLQPTSPAIDAGDNSFAAAVASDLAGNSRIHNTTVDLGAYEFGASPPVFRTLVIGAPDNGTITANVDPFENGYLDGASVELTATPDAGFRLDVWGGDASGTNNPLTITMDANKTISATFVPIITDDDVTVDNPSICFNESANVTLDGSDVGARYYLRNSSDNAVIDGPLDGDGNALVFSTGPMKNTTIFHVYGELIDDVTKNRQISTEVTVTVEDGDLLLQYPISGNVDEAIGGIASQNGVVSGALFAEGVDEDPFGALSFDGVNDVVTLGDAPIGSESFSVSLWVKVPTDGSESLNTIVLSKREACSEGRMFDISYRRSGDKVRFIASARNNASAGSVVTGFDFPVDEWVQLTYVKDNDTKTYRLIVNGVLEAEAAWALATVNLENNAPIRLGNTPCNGVDGTPRFDGMIDDFRVYDRIVEPSVTSIEPVRGTVGAALDTVITITFNKAVDVSSLSASSITLIDAQGESYAYSTAFSNGDSVLTIMPASPLPNGKTINVSIDTLATTSCTDFLPFQSSFSTVFTQLLSYSPANGISNVDSLETISFKFDHAIDMTTLEQGIRIIGSHQGPVAGTFSMPTTDSVVFTPSSYYFANERITAHVTPELKDAGGASIGNPRAFKFHVKSGDFTGTSLSYELTQLTTTGAISSPRMLVPVDMDDDGDLDLVGSDDGSRRLLFFENLGSGNYGTGQTIASGKGYFDVKVTDFDFDGDADVVTVDRSVSQGIYWHENDGSGNFSEHQIVALTNSDSRSISVEDFNGDGNLDVAVASFGSNRLAVYEKDGNQLFAAANVGGPIFVQASDINDDGDLDLFLANYTNGNVAQFSNSGSSIFGGLALHSATHLRAVVPIDIDHDGDIDIVYSAQSANQIGVLVNNGAGSFTNVQVGSVVAPHRIDVGDADGDGDLDIIYTNIATGADVNFYYLENSGSLTLWVSNKLIPSATFGSTFTQTAKFADVDNDGDLDVVATNANSGFYIFENMIVDLNEPPIISNPITDQTIEEDDADGLTIDVSNVFIDNDGDAFTLSASSDNAAVTANVTGNNLELELVTPDFSGDVNITVTADDGNGSNSDTFELSVTPVNDAPLFTLSTNLLTLDEDFSGTELVTLTQLQPDNEAAPTYSIALSNLSERSELAVAPIANAGGPATVGIDPATGEISITAVANANGSQTYIVTADDGAGTNNIATQQFTLTVNAVNDAPTVANAIADVSLDEDSEAVPAINIGNTFNDVDDVTLTYGTNILSGSDLVNITLVNTTINIEQISNAFGTVQIEVTTEDAAGLNASDVFDVVISPVNDMPTFAISGDLSLQTDFVGTEIVTVTPNAVPFGEDSQVVTYSLSPVSVTFANVNINSTTGEVSVTAVAGGAGSQEFTITADDGEAENNIATQTFTLNVIDNEAPEVVSEILDTTINEDQATLTIVNVTTVFTDAENDPLTYTVSDDFDGDVVVAINENLLQVTPTANYFGMGTITLTASDAGQSSSTSFDLTVNSVNDAPTVSSEVLPDASINEDEVYSTTLSSTLFEDVEGDAITLSIPSLPTWLSFDGATLSGTPGNENIGVLSIEVVGADGNGGSASRTFQLTIQNVNDVPTVVSAIADFIVDEDADATVLDLASIFEDVDAGDALSITASTAAETLISLSLANDELTLTYAENASGAATVTVTATDMSGATATDEFLVTVNSVNDAPIFTLSETAIEQEVDFVGVVTVDISAGVVPTDETDQTVTYNISSASSDVVNATINGTTIELTSIAGATGEQTFTITADDGQAMNNIHVVSLTVSVNRILSTSVISSEIRVYPNPVVNTLLFDSSSELEVQVYSEGGRLVLNKEISSELNVSHLQPGTYIIRIHTAEGVQTQRFIKEN